ncbi:MAG: T9SS type A sorting domain-containing protein [Bacteroidota bacterium]
MPDRQAGVCEAEYELSDVCRLLLLAGPVTHPRSFALVQNYPNPFNPKTVINYQQATSNWVTLKVFDMLGREVAVLVDEVKGPGEHSVSFDGSSLASGVYLYRLSAGGSVATKKLVLLR